MADHGDRVDVEQHRADVAELLAPLADRPQEVVPLHQDVLGRVLARDVTAPGALPRFRNSQMDGFAVRAADVAPAAPGVPVTLPVAGDVAAAPGEPAPLEPGTAVRIMTGAPLPAGADAVVPVEDTDHLTFNGSADTSGGGTVAVVRPRTAGEYVREPGSDVAAGDVVLRAGTVLAPHHVAAAAACGITRLPVLVPVSVAVVSTGSELVPPDGEPGPGQVWDANGPALEAAVRAAGGRVGLRVSVPDDPEVVRVALERAAALCDLVLTTGGVSQGAYEVVKDALPEVTFRSVAMQPGGPQGLGQVGGRPVLAFPGNPVSAQVSFVVFLRDLLRRAGGLPPVDRVTAVLDGAVASPPGRRQLLRGRWVRDDAVAGTPRVAVVGGPGSHLVASMAAADVLIDVPAATTTLEPGAEVAVWPL
ncbi:gephyrin-like molybdotransferase Glp [Promicromonospora thailandica]|uniref:Molybdopterin molybdenumtransferase n=1 Tax=Promicromonospora thailandica TaxID=765201 RepID=A0A9X2G796_9MICO|nr:gephyrin-like molybdotransferase Glp [Promicromonospora thailandica]MCP2263196.1 molybdopterin molybdotransferase [Promicromonospora thailandica]BFF18582.1 molybdopterin molybdotransferase MoeA [Promicromonospora thailandica]